MSDDQADAIAAASAVFENDVGVWDAEFEIRPAPGAEPIVQHAVASNKRIGGGRWLIVDYRSDSGFEGHGVYGWDPSIGKYTGIWVDSMGTSIARSVGTYDTNTRTATYVTEIMAGDRNFRYRETIQHCADGTRLYRNLVATPEGGEHEMIRMVYRKRP
jgi:hypothetical protein